MKTFCHLIGKYFGIIAVVFLILGMTPYPTALNG